ncbi:hypothetical protein [Streptomyces sp. NPDC057509]|uniref:hypothetical protein n=1 Tax=Streptomyces sp. NPDC057509 TaxID=3346152 RepID=UPI0036B0A921
MSAEKAPPPGQGALQTQIPAPGALVADVSRQDRVRVGEFRGVAGPYWMLRPAKGGAEWEVLPEYTRAATPAERLGARTARENARSRGEVA